MSENERPWGRYDVLYDGEDCKVKRITVKPDSILSYQYHDKRSEDWIIISGHGYVVLNDITSVASPGDRIHIPAGMKHRIGNNSCHDVVFIEIQTGTYFGEDDIVRLKDSYGRTS